MWQELLFKQGRELAQALFASRVLVACIVGAIYVLAMPISIALSLKVTVFMLGFSAVWATYLINVYTDKAEDEVNAAGIHVAVSLPFIVFVALAPLPLIVDKMGWRGLAFYTLFCFVCALYSLRLPLLNRRIKDVFLLKNIYPGLIVVGGIIMLRTMFGFPVFFIDLALIFLIYFGNEILWDIRDMYGDTPNSTLPQRLGPKATKALVIGIYVMVLAMYATHWSYLMFAAWLPIAIAIAVTLKVRPNQNPLLFHLPVLAWASFLGLLLCL